MALAHYAVPASHPCAAVGGALIHKGLPYRRIDLPQGAHFVHQRLRFGVRTVPGLMEEGRKVVGSHAIMRALDELRPAPPLLPSEADARAAVLAAEAWNDEVLQSAARRLAWVFIPRAGHKAAASYVEDAQMPGPPALLASLLGDLDPVLAGRPAVDRARELFPRWLGRTPPGLL